LPSVREEVAIVAFSPGGRFSGHAAAATKRAGSFNHPALSHRQIF
jgi:hypothetical protein